VRELFVDVAQLVLDQRVLDLQHGLSYPVVVVHRQLEVNDVGVVA